MCYNSNISHQPHISPNPNLFYSDDDKEVSDEVSVVCDVESNNAEIDDNNEDASNADTEDADKEEASNVEAEVDAADEGGEFYGDPHSIFQLQADEDSDEDEEAVNNDEDYVDNDNGDNASIYSNNAHHTSWSLGKMKMRGGIHCFRGRKRRYF